MPLNEKGWAPEQFPREPFLDFDPVSFAEKSASSAESRPAADERTLSQATEVKPKQPIGG